MPYLNFYKKDKVYVFYFNKKVMGMISNAIIFQLKMSGMLFDIMGNCNISVR